MRAFLVTAEEGSLSAAARALNSSQPTLGRQVSALEDELGLALFERIGTKLTLTPGGLELIQHARAMCDAATRASLTASGQSQSLEGTVCISVGEIFAGHVLPPIIEKLRMQEPGIEIEIVASNSSSDLRRREADIGFRALKPTQPDLIAKKVCDLTSRFYASSGYLEKIGYPQTMEDLCRADFIDFDDTGVYRKYLNDLGFNLTPRNFPVRAESHFLQWELAKSGVGIVTALEMIGDAEPAMERALSDFMLVHSMWLVAHRELKTSRRIKMVFDFLYREFKAICVSC
ncbi:LysR family transcriptional regulator [Iodidimonas gelatinilytica]|uniref:LysR family transcriptional regulator n=2 Tax=Iodidimonas gelatinilytica TaxID=1236966 RepID=A0A5A7N4G7_9PROT|nr:LysR family transcriptional regulator [Iodidimonas gelatinilytica]